MKTLTFFIVLSLLSGLAANSQIYHSALQIDSKNTFNISRGISRGNLTFVIDQVKLKLSLKSNFLNFENKDITFYEYRTVVDENGQSFLRSKYQITDGLYLYIEDYKTEQSNLLVKYNKAFALEAITDGETKSFMVCFITEPAPPIKYNPKTPLANYQSFKSDYRVEGDENPVVKRNDVIIEIDTTNHYLSINGQRRNGYSYIEIGEMTHLESLWTYKKYQMAGSGSEMLTIYSTKTPVKINNSLYDKIFTLYDIDLITKETSSNIDLYVSSSSPTKESQDTQYFEKPDGGY